jgi:hypothetical protein
MLKALRLTILGAALLPMLVITVSVAAVCYLIEQEPLVRQSPAVEYDTLVAGKALLKRIVRRVESADDKGITLAVTEEELRHIARMGSHTFARLNADFYFDRAAINSRVSLRLLPNPVGLYLNFAFQIGQSGEGLSIDRLAIGPLILSGYPRA